MIFFLFSCFSIQRFDAPISSSSLWKHTENYSQFDHAWEYSQQHDGKALLILENDTLIYSAYAHEYHPEIPLPFWSGTKTLACFLAYDAQNKGMMTLDEIVADTITEWKSDPTKNNITVLDLLQFTSGLKQDFFGLSLDGFRPPEQQTILDKYQHAIHLPMESSPGQSWSYGSVHLTVFALFFSQKTGMSIQESLEDNVFRPLNFQYSGWNQDPKGQRMLAYGLWTTSAELLKLGVLLRDDGMFQGNRILPPGLLKFCSQSSSINPAYGMSIWINNDMPDSLPFSKPTFQKEGTIPIFHSSGIQILAFVGAKGQRVYIIPSRDWVVVHQAQDGEQFSDTEFLHLILSPEIP